jgi:CheY-like chemotaxis protein
MEMSVPDKAPNVAHLQQPAQQEDAGSARLHVLIVEDEMVVAMLIEDMVVELGYEVSGVATQVADAIALVERDSFDLAILDVNLNGKEVFPLADILEGRGIPFMFATAYGRRGIPERFLYHPVIQKPFSSLDLRKALQGLS